MEQRKKEEEEAAKLKKKKTETYDHYKGEFVDLKALAEAESENIPRSRGKEPIGK